MAETFALRDVCLWQGMIAPLKPLQAKALCTDVSHCVCTSVSHSVSH